ncbi:1,3-beta-glucanosyltransferase [Gamsiella multidivaricata]|nr:1,3-beta-glucanosyltransferase [Gamsiella multidivaricata]
MKLNLGLAGALLIVATQAATTDTKSANMLKISITTIQGGRRPSTVGRWVHTLRKYGVSRSMAGGVKSIQRGGVAEGERTSLARVPLIDYDFDREYYGTVMVGEPPQSFKAPQSSSSPPRAVSNAPAQPATTPPPPTPSSSTATTRTKSTRTTALLSLILLLPIPPLFSPPPVPSTSNAWHITYGDFSHAEGYLGRDHVRIENLVVQDQQLALITSESANFDDVIDGIMGLAFGSLSAPSSSSSWAPKPRTVFENMMDQGLVERGMFSFFLGKNRRDGLASLDGTRANGGGEVIFGGMDMGYVKEGHEIVWTNVTKPKYWQINVENIWVDRHRVDFKSRGFFANPGFSSALSSSSPSSSSGSAKSKQEKKDEEAKSDIPGIMDTGTTLLIMPERLAAGIHAMIPRAVQVYGQSWALPCELAKETKKLELGIEGHRFAIPFSDLVREEVAQGEVAQGEVTHDNGLTSDHDSLGKDKDKDKDTKKPANLCFSGIQPSSAGFMIIGDLFIKNNYVVFDQENKRVGIAPLRFESDTTAAEVNAMEKKRRGTEMRTGWEIAEETEEAMGL